MYQEIPGVFFDTFWGVFWYILRSGMFWYILRRFGGFLVQSEGFLVFTRMVSETLVLYRLGHSLRLGASLTH